VPSRPGIRSALALAGLALGHKPHAQRLPSLDQMGVPRLHLPMAPGIRSALALAGLALGMYVRRNFRSRGAITRQPRVPASVILARPHPTQQAAYLPYSRPPDCDFCAKPRRPARQSVSSGSHTHRAFITTRAGFDNMARRHRDTYDEITEADNTAGAATFGGAPTRGPRQVTLPVSMPADLPTALDMPTTYGPKLFEITALHAVSAAYKVKVKDTGDLLLLRDWLFEELGPPYMWTVMLSPRGCHFNYSDCLSSDPFEQQSRRGLSVPSLETAHTSAVRDKMLSP
jgi:hypothetical protein